MVKRKTEAGGQPEQEEKARGGGPRVQMVLARQAGGTMLIGGGGLTLTSGNEMRSVPTEGAEQKGSKEPIPEEQELEFRGVDELDERPENEYDMEFYKEPDRTENEDAESQAQEVFLTVPEECEPSAHRAEPDMADSASDAQGQSKPADDAVNLGQPAQLSPATVSTLSSSSPSSSPPYPSTVAEFAPVDNDDDDGMKRFEQEAEKMVASLHDNSLDDERFVEMMQDQRNRAAAALPLSHEAAMKWFYKDPQGEIQAINQATKRTDKWNCGLLTALLKMLLYVSSAPSWPGDMDQGRLKKQRELAAALYHQLQYQQFLQLINSRQQLVQCALQQKANMTPQQQQQLVVFLQQIQALKSRDSKNCRCWSQRQHGMELEEQSRPGSIRGAGKLMFRVGTLLQKWGGGREL
eukprot:g47894.t1